MQAVFDEIRGVDAVFSPYRADSAVSRLTRGEISIEDCPAAVSEVAARCARATELTGGLFQPRRPEGMWDPSGLVKGWAAELAFRHLAGVASCDWCLNAGGDVVVLCPSGQPFQVGIQDPRDPSRVAAVVPAAGGGVATSGASARGAHIYDPGTGLPATPRWASVTVTGLSLETADVLATAAFVAGDGWSAILQPGYEGLAIGVDGVVAGTSGWPGRLSG